MPNIIRMFYIELTSLSIRLYAFYILTLGQKHILNYKRRLIK
jgi:hypothetical protein